MSRSLAKENIIVAILLRGSGYLTGSGIFFMVAVHDRSKETLMQCLKEWIEPGKTIFSDGWKSYKDLGKEGFQHLLVKDSINFVDSESGCNINTIVITWPHVKSGMKLVFLLFEEAFVHGWRY
ncbi:uncharacterized protein LOC118194117 [Stegodyphus dumicola]|uniref:uncharacterized protein LOC118194117 n=1 Tax=Stegodyphus dumicola TaxID=202533 RepID=UPI0015AF1196|nr:uncharacterized protein LOC118194117 [Stegodyphus dumicola]